MTFSFPGAGRMVSTEVAAGMVTFTYNADGQRVAKQSTDGSVVGYLYDDKRLLHETDDVGGDVSNTYAAGTQEEFGDLIGEGDGQSHAYDAQANTNALLVELESQSAALDQISGSISALSQQLQGFIAENRETIVELLGEHQIN